MISSFKWNVWLKTLVSHTVLSHPLLLFVIICQYRSIVGDLRVFVGVLESKQAHNAADAQVLPREN